MLEGRQGFNYQPIQEMPFWGNWENFIDNWMKLEKIQIKKKIEFNIKALFTICKDLGENTAELGNLSSIGNEKVLINP